ncbi:hypothetical protein, conserved [Eimeria maxima]|uniref:Amine oxidase domain-containing protein n=1 Tax=Eimeria maxima TaxID=5804 RepID=U6MG44_EIMMA|nr:hypothetical protein, conserved [Eimeria maxima]CDJ60605.1 hypothetical protein, conserved [Eimeria maxima]
MFLVYLQRPAAVCRGLGRGRSSADRLRHLSIPAAATTASSATTAAPAATAAFAAIAAAESNSSLPCTQDGPLGPLQVDVLIVGGGLTGLSAAYALQRLQQRLQQQQQRQKEKQECIIGRNLSVCVVEAAAEVGGCIRSRRSACGGFLWDCGANSFRLTEELQQLLQLLQLQQSLLLAPHGAPRFAAVKGHLIQLPNTITSFLRTDLLSPLAKIKCLRGLLLGAKPWLPAAVSRILQQQQQQQQQQDLDDLSVEDYITKVLGEETARNIINNMTIGIYACPAAALCMSLAFPSLKLLLDKGLIRYFISKCLLNKGLIRPFICNAINKCLLNKGIKRALSSVPFINNKQLKGPKLPAASNSSSSGREQQQWAPAGARGAPLVASFLGGMQELTNGLFAAVGSSNVLLQSRLMSLHLLSKRRKETIGFLATVSSPKGDTSILAKHVLLTVNPKEVARLLGPPTEASPPVECAGIHRKRSAPGGPPGDLGSPTGGSGMPPAESAGRLSDPQQEVIQPILSAAAVQQLNALPFSSVTVVTIALRPAAAAPAAAGEGALLTPPGFGFLVSPYEAKDGWETLGALSISRLFKGRAPPGYEVLTAFVKSPPRAAAATTTAGEKAATADEEKYVVDKVLKDIKKIHANMNLHFIQEETNSNKHKVTLSTETPAAKAPFAGGSVSVKEAGDSVTYLYRVLGVHLWEETIPTLSLSYRDTRRAINNELQQLQKQQFPSSLLLLEGGWVSGVAVGDRITAGNEAAKIILMHEQRQQQQKQKEQQQEQQTLASGGFPGPS